MHPQQVQIIDAYQEVASQVCTANVKSLFEIVA